MLALIRPDSGDADQPQLAPALVHLERCADCQAAFESQQKGDRELAQAMRRVSVPVDLKARLLAQLNVAAPQPVPSTIAEPSAPLSPAATQPARPHWRRRQLAVLASAAVLVLAFGAGWWFIQTSQRPVLAFNDLLSVSHQPVTAQAFQKSFTPEFPVREIRMLPPAQATNVATSLRHQQREIGAVVPYRIDKLSVILVVINLRSVEVPEKDLKAVGTSFQQASVYYPKPNAYATRVWRSGQNLYVCYVRSRHPQDLESLSYQSSTT